MHEAETELLSDFLEMRGKSIKNKQLGSDHSPVWERALNSAAAAKKPTFYDRVYALVEEIPTGKVTTYGAIAETLGMKSSSRLVGQALNSIPEGSDLPAQRVINRIGALSGAHHFGGYARMRKMLEKEGVKFRGELVDMAAHFWHPSGRTALLHPKQRASKPKTTPKTSRLAKPVKK